MTREEAAKLLEKQFDESCGDYRYQNKDKLDYEDASLPSKSMASMRIAGFIVLP